jgi:putative nucleotidyltransferase with HDIG domain
LRIVFPTLLTFSRKLVAALRRAFEKSCRHPVVYFPFSAKICILITVLLVITISSFYFITVQRMANHVQSEVAKRAESLARNIASSARYSFSSGDLLGLDSIAFQTKLTNSDVEYIYIADTAEKAVVHTTMAKSGKPVEPTNGRLLKSMSGGTVLREVSYQGTAVFEVQTPIVFGDKKLGSVVVGLNKSVLLDTERSIRNTLFTILASVLSLGIVGSVFLSTVITKPIKELSSGVEELKQGGQSHLLTIYRKDELGQLTENFNEMSARIAEQQVRLNEYASELEESYVSIVKVVAATIDARDPYTHGHSARVSRFSLQIGERIGLDSTELEDLRVACLLHDVGKIKTPDSILMKPSRLSLPEQKEMMRHPEYGASILGKASSLHKYIPAVRHHHERFDGQGYPDGLKGTDIPRFAAIMAVADAFDAMTSDRPYRKALSKDEALQELIRCAGTQFDPEIAGCFVELRQQTPISEDNAYATV